MFWESIAEQTGLLVGGKRVKIVEDIGQKSISNQLSQKTLELE